MKYILLFSLFLVPTSLIIGQRGLEAGALIQPQIYGQVYTMGEPDRAIKVPYSFGIGANLTYNFSDFFGIRSGLIYSPLGEKYNDISTDPEQAVDVNLEYLQVPLLLKFNSSPENRMSFLLVAGPHISYLNNASISIDGGEPTGVLSQYERFVLGGSLGIGLQFNLNRGDNVNFLWYNSAAINPINTVLGVESRYISTGLQLAYHYFIFGG
jgi:hypothetical protein